MGELLRKKRLWVAIAAVLAVVLNHFYGFDETRVVELVGVIIAAIVLSLALAGGCGYVEQLGPQGATYFTQVVNQRVEPADLKLSDAQERAFGVAMYGTFEDAYQAARDLFGDK